MPWCDPCAKYWAPNAVWANAACPTCGLVLATPRQLRTEAKILGPGAKSGSAPAAGSDDPGSADTGGGLGDGGLPAKAPWHFKLLVVGVVIYLGYRVVQLFMAIFT